MYQKCLGLVEITYNNWYTLEYFDRKERRKMGKLGGADESGKKFESKEAFTGKEDLAMESKKVLMLKGKLDVRERRLALEHLFGEGVEMLFVDGASSVDELNKMISENSAVVMIEAEIMTLLVLAEIILTTKIPQEIQIRESLMTTYRADDKTSWLSLFRKYGDPLREVYFK